MINILAFSTRKFELAQIRKAAADYSIRFEWAENDLYISDDLREWERIGNEARQIDVLICDVTEPEAIQSLTKLKQNHEQAVVVPITDETVLPTAYVRPDIMPCALLWRPMAQHDVLRTIQTALNYLHARFEQTDSRSMFELRTRREVRYIPYGSIFFFEAADKKLRLRLARSEISFQGTLGRIEQNLPKDFIRCHKSYIVNCSHIMIVRQNEQMIELEEHLEIPFSRGYRKTFLEAFYGRNT